MPVVKSDGQLHIKLHSKNDEAIKNNFLIVSQKISCLTFPIAIIHTKYRAIKFPLVFCTSFDKLHNYHLIWLHCQKSESIRKWHHRRLNNYRFFLRVEKIIKLRPRVNFNGELEQTHVMSLKPKNILIGVEKKRIKMTYLARIKRLSSVF